MDVSAVATVGGMTMIGTFRGRCTDRGQGTPIKRTLAKVATKWAPRILINMARPGSVTARAALTAVTYGEEEAP